MSELQGFKCPSCENKKSARVQVAMTFSVLKSGRIAGGNLAMNPRTDVSCPKCGCVAPAIVFCPQRWPELDPADEIHLSANALRWKYDNQANRWGEHPKYPMDAWSHEAGQRDTRIGYYEWVEGQIEQADEELDNDAGEEGGA